MFTTLANNPAFAGSNEGINVTALIRQQSIGFKDNEGKNLSPQTIYISIDSPIKFLHGGLGGSVITDKIAQFSTTDVRLDYAYRFELGQGEFSAGAQLDINNTKVDFGSLVATEDKQNDPALAAISENKNDLVLDLGIGLFYKVPDKYYIGFSGTDLLQTKETKIRYQLKRTLFLTGGYNWLIPNHPLFELQPSILIRTDFGSYSMEISGLVLYNKKVYGGLAYRYQDAISILVGLNWKSFRFGISYDATTSPLARYDSGGIEVMANYCFKISTDKFRKSYKNTRFL